MINNLPFEPTPIDVISINIGDYKWGGVKFKRDDVFYLAGGGSKARMLQYILADVNRQNYDVLITAGGPCSNFNRACALMCASLGIQMHLIVYTNHENEYEESENYFICKLSGVKFTRCKKTHVMETIDRVMNEYASNGIRAKNIYGGGRCIEGIYAYYDAVSEISHQLVGKMPKKVFVACGTGTTTAGLIAGFQEISPETEVHAISVARKWQDEKPVIEEDIQWLNFHTNKKYDLSNLFFHDDFIMGEYGATTPELLKFIKDFTSNTGILIDPIYTGKALFGMANILMDDPCDNVLFWHTGAIYTLMSNRHQFNDI